MSLVYFAISFAFLPHLWCEITSQTLQATAACRRSCANKISTTCLQQLLLLSPTASRLSLPSSIYLSLCLLLSLSFCLSLFPPFHLSLSSSNKCKQWRKTQFSNAESCFRALEFLVVFIPMHIFNHESPTLSSDGQVSSHKSKN